MFTVSPAWHVTGVRVLHSSPIHENMAGNVKSRGRRVACLHVREDKLVDAPIMSYDRLPYGALAQLARALHLHCRGQGFESLMLH